MGLDLIPAPGVARRLAVLTLVQAGGSSLFVTSSAIFFVRVVGLRPAEVGLGLSIAGLAGFAATVPLGRLADRVGARRLLALDHAVLVLLFALYPLARGFVPFVVVAALIAVGELSASPLRSALVHAAFRSEEAVRTRAQLRGAFNVGYLLGAAVAGIALAAPSLATFIGVCAATALAQGLCVVIVVRTHIPDQRPRPDRRRGGAAWRDGRFLLVTFANGLLELHLTVLTVGLPLWIVSHTRAPTSLASGLIIVNTVVVLLLQVRLARGADTIMGAAALSRRAGALLAAGCVVAAFSPGEVAWRSAVVLLAAVGILTVGEILQAAGGWGLSFELPPPGRQAEYQGVFALGRGVQQFLGPALVTALLVGLGPPGWLLLATLFLLTGLAVPLLLRPRQVRRVPAGGGG